jgi:hypothetical protein
MGRAIVRPPRARVPAFLAGWAIAAVIGLVPFLNLAFWGLGSMFGIGAMTVAAWRGRGGASGRHRVGAAGELAVTVPEPAAPATVASAAGSPAEPYPATSDD